jgi:hypothetical protein
MHDSEKSDSAIVAVKPPNKAGLPVAEAVEPRAGAKDAVRQSRQRCWRYDWVLDIDVKGYFDETRTSKARTGPRAGSA